MKRYQTVIKYKPIDVIIIMAVQMCYKRAFLYVECDAHFQNDLVKMILLKHWMTLQPS